MPQYIKLKADEQQPEESSLIRRSIEGGFRNLTRGIVDVGSAIGGIPGTVQQLQAAGEQGLKQAGKALTGYDIFPTPEEIVGQEPSFLNTEGIKFPTPQQIKGKAEEFFPKDYLQPQSKAEEYSDIVMGYLPQLAFGPGSILARIVQTGLQAGAGIASKSLGAGKGLQGAAEFAAGIPSLMWNLSKGSGKVLDVANKLKKSSYDEATLFGKNAPIRVTPLVNDIKKRQSEFTRSLSKASQQVVDKETNHLLRNIVPKKSNLIVDEFGRPFAEGSFVQNVVDAKKGLGELLSKPTKSLESPMVRGYFEQLYGDIKKYLHGPIAEQYPEWYQPWNIGETIHRAEKSQNAVNKLLKSSSFAKQVRDLTPLMKVALGVGTLGFKKGISANLFLAGLSAKEQLDILRQMTEVPQIQQAMQNLSNVLTTYPTYIVASKLKEIDKQMKPYVDEIMPKKKKGSSYVKLNT